MKTTISKIALPVILGMMLVTMYVLLQKPWQAFAGVEVGSEYYSTTTSATTVGTSLLKVGSGSLGSVLVTGTTPGELYLYDATTTNATLRTNTATTTLAHMHTTATPGTYAFDTVFNYGLLMVFSNGVSTSTITWR